MKVESRPYYEDEKNLKETFKDLINVTVCYQISKSARVSSMPDRTRHSEISMRDIKRKEHNNFLQ